MTGLFILRKLSPPHYSKFKKKHSTFTDGFRNTAIVLTKRRLFNPVQPSLNVVNFSCLPWISQTTIILETPINNSEEQNICLPLQCFKFCGKFTPFVLQPVLINMWNVVFPFCVSSKEASVCFENCGNTVSARVSPRPAITPVVERLRLQQTSQLEKGGEGRGRKGDTEKSKTLSCSKESLLPNSIGQ